MSDAASLTDRSENAINTNDPTCICLPGDPFDTCPVHGDGQHGLSVDTVVVNDNGLAFTVRRVETNGTYGMRNTIITEVPLVEFYDRRYMSASFDPIRGQFVSRYTVDSLLGRDRFTPGRHRGPLQLDAGIRDWRIDAQGMEYVIAWLEQRDRISELALGDLTQRAHP